MKTKLVKELMVPLSEYATIPGDATLNEAVAALRAAQNGRDDKYPHRAVLIFDEKKRIVGKIDLLCILRALEPKYDKMLSREPSLHLGFTREFQKAMLEQLKLWDGPMEHICRKACDKKVESFMVRPTDEEHIEAGATLDEAIHQMIMGHYQSLLVTKDGEILGILRLTDVFETVADAIESCGH